MKKKTNKPIIAWMAWNFNNPWPFTMRATRRDCIKDTVEIVGDEETVKQAFSFSKVKITPIK
jgi:hypothetical protein